MPTSNQAEATTTDGARSPEPDRGSGERAARREITSFCLRQRYPTFAPPGAAAGHVYVVKVLASTAELVQSYRLRYDVYDEIGYLQRENRANLEIDEYDDHAIPLGAICLETRELVGTLRLVTEGVQRSYQRRIRRILDLVADPALAEQVERPRARRLPSLTSRHIEDQIDGFDPERRAVNEISRYIVHPSHRGSCVQRGLLEVAVACARAWGDPILLASCNPRHVPMNARFGFLRLPGVEDAVSDVVGRYSSTIVCDPRNLPEPAASRVAGIVEALRRGEPECLLDGGESWRGARGRYHFGERVAATEPTPAEHRVG